MFIVLILTLRLATMNIANHFFICWQHPKRIHMKFNFNFAECSSLLSLQPTF